MYAGNKENPCPFCQTSNLFHWLLDARRKDCTEETQQQVDDCQQHADICKVREKKVGIWRCHQAHNESCQRNTGCNDFSNNSCQSSRRKRLWNVNFIAATVHHEKPWLERVQFSAKTCATTSSLLNSLWGIGWSKPTLHRIGTIKCGSPQSATLQQQPLCAKRVL